MRRALLLAFAGLLMAAPAAGAQGLTGAWGRIGEGPGQFDEMIDIATSGPYVYTVEKFAGDGRVQKFTSDGKLVRTFGRPQDEDKRFDTDQIPGALYYPTGIAIGPGGNVYVSEDGSDRTRISVWSPRGKFLRSFGTSGSGPGQISNAQGLTVDGAGNVFVGDSDRVGVFGGSGNWLGGIGESSEFDGVSVSNATDVALAGSRLFIPGFSSIRVWNTNNTPVGAFGESGSEPGIVFQSISSLAFYGSTMYVADRGLSRVQAFSVNGNEVRYLAPVGTSPGAQPGQLNKPVGVATDCRGTVYVADSGNNRVQKFGARGAPACGSLASDPLEKFQLALGGKKRQRFASNFAVRPAVKCDRPCVVSLSGSVKIRGRKKAVKLTGERKVLEYPDSTGINVAPSEKGTDVIASAVRRRRSTVARIKLTARDLTGRKRTLKKSYRLVR